MSLGEIAAPLLFAAFAWWFSTGAILWLDRRPQKSFGWILAIAGAIACAAVGVLYFGGARNDMLGAYISFSAALLIWGWHEMSFLMGFITGPRRAPLPIGVTGLRRFTMAAGAVLYHELALAGTALALLALSWGQSNQVGALTFLLLWGLRLSAKLNLFLGAPHTGAEMLPSHLAYLGSYFRNRPMNALFPLSLFAGAAVICWIGAVGFQASATDFQRTGATLLITLAALGLIEHVFMFLPPPNALLWAWAMPRRSDEARRAHSEG